MLFINKLFSKYTLTERFVHQCYFLLCISRLITDFFFFFCNNFLCIQINLKIKILCTINNLKNINYKNIIGYV